MPIAVIRLAALIDKRVPKLRCIQTGAGQIGQQAADEQPRNSRRCEHRQNGQSFGDPNLYRTERNGRKEQRQRDISGSDERAVGKFAR